MDITKAIELAIEEEIESQKKYKAASEAAVDAQTRLMFAQMARDEEVHERILRDRLKALRLIKNC